MFVALSSCPPGWGIEPAASVELAKLAVDTGVWPLKELRDEHVLHTVVPHRFRPVEEYLRPQERYRHLFEPERQGETLHRLQADVDLYWERARANAEVPGGQQRPAAPKHSTSIKKAVEN
jgi:pyruvate ferredoxin oxidoreductase beta subunit